MLDRKLPRIHQDHVGLFERHCEKAIQVLARNSVQFHVASGIEDSKESAVHRLNELVRPRDRSYASARIAVERETRFLKHVQPFDIFMPVRRGQSPESQRNEAIHGHFQPLIELAVNAVDAQDLCDLTPGESYGLGKVVLECQRSQGDKDVQVLLCR